MRRRSAKQAKLYREWTPKRQAWLAGRGYVCAECGGTATDVHEICCGSSRQAAFIESACWLALCRRDHDDLQSTDVLYQLALKLLSDPKHFDLPAFLKAWDRAPTAITPAEVLAEVQNVLIDRDYVRIAA